MEINCIHLQILVHLHVNKTNFHMKDFALGLALKRRQKATRKLPICMVTVKGNSEITYLHGNCWNLLMHYVYLEHAPLISFK